MKRLFLNTIKKAYSVFYRRFLRVQWACETSNIKRLIRDAHINLTDSPESLKGKILILAPHSDDEWIGCSSLIKRNPCIICSMDMVGDNDLETREMRRLEMEAASAAFRKKLVFVGLDKVASLGEIIENEKPSVIAVPFFIDWHDEHIETMRILKESIKDYCGSILTYQVSCPLPLASVNFAIPMTKEEWEDKWRFFNDNYKTQKGFPWKRFALIEKAQGAYCNSYAANVFRLFSRDEWIESFDEIQTLVQKEYLKSDLNHPARIYRFANEVWNKANNCF